MHIHFLGICGTFMGSLAILAKQLGYQVTGQDHNIYPPMSTALQQAGIEIQSGYEVSPALHQADQIILGNALSRGNPCVEQVLNHRLNYFSGPEWLEHHILRHRRVLAVAGTHGKTTTTSMLTWILKYAGCDPGFLIGGVCKAWEYSAQLGTGDCFVIEADEYDTAFFDKRSKFIHYRPSVLVINNLEFDHADIFSDLAAIEVQFHQLIRTMPSEGSIIMPKSNEALQRVLDRGYWSQLRILADEGLNFESNASGGQLFQHQELLGTLNWDHKGQHNLQNALSAIGAAQQVGISLSKGLEALSHFPGVKRRLDLLEVAAGISVYDDFAHHPTAIRETLNTLKPATQGKLIAVIEPRSNSMKMGAHKGDLIQATANADAVFWLDVGGLDWDIQSITHGRSDHWVFQESKTLIRSLLEQVADGDTLVFMSNGGFEQIQQRTIAALKDLS